MNINEMSFYDLTPRQKKEFLNGCEAFLKEIDNFENRLDASEQTLDSFINDPPDTPFQMGFLHEAYATNCNEIDPQEH